MSFPWLTCLTVLPLLGGFIVVGLDERFERFSRRLALLFQSLALALVIGVIRSFDTSASAMQFVEQASWIPSIQANYHLGIDGLGLLMIALAALILPFATLMTAPGIRNSNLYYALLLWVQAGLFGAFTALSFVHWFVFWELSLIPAYFLIKT